jgi:hypothetical protein
MNYNRERLGRINLTIEAAEQQQRLKQHALYNSMRTNMRI